MPWSVKGCPWCRHSSLPRTVSAASMLGFADAAMTKPMPKDGIF
jgi:hypothetical protein